MATAAKPKPRDDAYVVLLSISLLSMIAACVLLYYDLKRYPSPKPPANYGAAAPITTAPRIDDTLPTPPTPPAKPGGEEEKPSGG